jgi:hypothetical protein
MAGICSSHGKDEKLYRILIVKPVGKMPLQRRKQGWVVGGDIKTDLSGIGYENMRLIDVTEGKYRW